MNFSLSRGIVPFIKESSPAFRYVLTAGIILISLILWYSFVYKPLVSRRTFYYQLWLAQQAKDNDMKDVPSTSNSITTVERVSDAATFLEKSLSILKKYDVTVTACTLQKGNAKKQTMMNYRCAIQAIYENIVFALGELEKLSPLVICRQMMLKKETNGCKGTLTLSFIENGT